MRHYIPKAITIPFIDSDMNSFVEGEEKVCVRVKEIKWLDKGCVHGKMLDYVFTASEARTFVEKLEDALKQLSEKREKIQSASEYESDSPHCIGEEACLFVNRCMRKNPMTYYLLQHVTVASSVNGETGESILTIHPIVGREPQYTMLKADINRKLIENVASLMNAKIVFEDGSHDAD
jgi:hypothetical protein